MARTVTLAWLRMTLAFLCYNVELSTPMIIFKLILKCTQFYVCMILLGTILVSLASCSNLTFILLSQVDDSLDSSLTLVT